MPAAAVGFDVANAHSRRDSAAEEPGASGIDRLEFEKIVRILDREHERPRRLAKREVEIDQRDRLAAQILKLTRHPGSGALAVDEAVVLIGIAGERRESESERQFEDLNGTASPFPRAHDRVRQNGARRRVECDEDSPEERWEYPNLAVSEHETPPLLYPLGTSRRCGNCEVQIATAYRSAPDVLGSRRGCGVVPSLLRNSRPCWLRTTTG